MNPLDSHLDAINSVKSISNEFPMSPAGIDITIYASSITIYSDIRSIRYNELEHGHEHNYISRNF